MTKKVTNKIAIVFRSSPHGSAKGREALDMALACSAVTTQISLYFVSAGVFHLLPSQQPDKILARDYISTFGVLDIYDMDKLYVCRDSLDEYGLSHGQLSLNVKLLSVQELANQLVEQDKVFTF